MNSIYILGVRIDDVDVDQAIGTVTGWLTNQEKKKRYIFTPNPEFLIAADKDPEFKQVLNKGDLNLPDGHGLKLSGQIKNTVAGVDFMEILCREGAKKGWKVGFLGGREGVAKKCAEVLERKYPGLKVSFVDDGGEIKKDGAMLNTQYLIPDTDILFVGFGHIKQEKWVDKYSDKVDARVFMGVGGSFDYLAGEVKRAPVWMRKLGLEWLFRLALQPWRIKRQINLVKFIYKLSSEKI